MNISLLTEEEKIGVIKSILKFPTDNHISLYREYLNILRQPRIPILELLTPPVIFHLKSNLELINEHNFWKELNPKQKDFYSYLIENWNINEL